MTNKQKETIKRNLHAYCANFELPVIVDADYGGGFYVFRNAEEYKNGGSYVQFCHNVDYLDGWLYGAVQAVCGQIRKVKEEHDGIDSDVKYI